MNGQKFIFFFAPFIYKFLNDLKKLIPVETIIRQFSKIIKEFIYERSKKAPKIEKIAKFFNFGLANPGFCQSCQSCQSSLFEIRFRSGKIDLQIGNFKEIEVLMTVLISVTRLPRQGIIGNHMPLSRLTAC